MDNLDSMDELIGILNNKQYQPPKKTFLKPIGANTQADAEFIVNDTEDSFEEMPTQKHFYKSKQPGLAKLPSAHNKPQNQRQPSTKLLPSLENNVQNLQNNNQITQKNQIDQFESFKLSNQQVQPINNTQEKSNGFTIKSNYSSRQRGLATLMPKLGNSNYDQFQATMNGSSNPCLQQQQQIQHQQIVQQQHVQHFQPQQGPKLGKGFHKMNTLNGSSQYDALDNFENVLMQKQISSQFDINQTNQPESADSLNSINQLQQQQIQQQPQQLTQPSYANNAQNKKFSIRNIKPKIKLEPIIKQENVSNNPQSYQEFPGNQLRDNSQNQSKYMSHSSSKQKFYSNSNQNDLQNCSYQQPAYSAISRIQNNENRLTTSKHILIKTFTRYLANPKQFMKQTTNLNELVCLNEDFNDPLMVAGLFRSGADTLDNNKRHELVNSRKKRFLTFRPYMGTPKDEYWAPEDKGYYFKMPNSNVRMLQLSFRDNGFNETNLSKAMSVLWQTGGIKAEVYNQLSPWQKVNHFPKSFEITRKDLLARNISNMAAKHGKAFDFVPKSYLLPQEMALLMHDHDKNNHRQSKWYICKPSCSSQGKGIFVTNNLDQILSKGMHNFVIHQYISNPLLIDGLKFDLRIYVVVTSVKPQRIYLYEEGLARFASEQFSLSPENMHNNYVHLTNFSINKKHADFTVDQDRDDIGNKWSLTALKTRLAQLGYDVGLINMRIEDIIIKTILSIEDKLFKAVEKNVPYYSSCFEMLGFDVLIDDKLNPWLLEVNLSASLGAETNLDCKIKSNLIANILTLIGVVPLNMRDNKLIEPHRVNRKMQTQYGNAYKKKKKFQEKPETGKSIRKQEIAIITETREEVARSGKMKLIFPSFNVALYKNFFEADRPYNAVLRNEVIKNLGKIRSTQDEMRNFN